MTMPEQKPGRSKQDYATPEDFVGAVLKFLGRAEFVFDFAADETNTVSVCYWDAEVNSLAQSAEDWADMVVQPHMSRPEWGWLNMPFAKIDPWVQLAWEASRLGAHIAVLVPAGVGSNWWRDWVHGKCRVLLLNGRLKFKGCADYYPKDCCLLLYTPDYDEDDPPAYQVWTWRQ